MQMPKNDHWDKIYGSFKENYRGESKTSEK